MSFIPKMNNLVIKSEDIIDLTDTEVKQEEIDDDCIFVDDEESEVIPITREGNKICASENFETVFLPEVYTGVAVETPFFDIISYRRKYACCTENEDISKFIMHENSYCNENGTPQNVKQDEAQIESANSYNYTTSIIINNVEKIPDSETYGCYEPHSDELISDSSDSNYVDTNVSSKSNLYMHQYDVRMQGITDENEYNYMHEYDDRMQGISHENGYNYQTPTNVLQPPTNIMNKYDNSLAQTCLRRVNQVDSALVNTRLQQDRQVQCKEGYKSPTSNRWIKYWSKIKIRDEESKYKCPLCKLPKTFDTLLAANNHLKFEHMSLFTSKKVEEEDTIDLVDSALDSALVKNRLQQDRQSRCEEECKKVPSERLIKYWKRKICDEESKYKCPLCKKPKNFDTLFAVNNHLKFEHLSLFSNKRLEVATIDSVIESVSCVVKN